MERFKFVLALISVFACGQVLAGGTVYTFTSGGASGSTGPDQVAIDAAYLGTPLEGAVVVTGGIQEWEVPLSSRFRIEAFGGQGWGDFGGRGAHISGEFDLTAGTNLRILVGQMAGPYLNFPAPTYNHQFGGGGGSFVMQAADADLNNDVPLVVAGGGGGNHGASFVATADGQTGTAGEAGANASLVGAGGVAGAGGEQASSADGGGGWLTDGTGGGAQGQAYVNGGLGGFDEGFGGFGGGGGTSSWNNYRGGGGGGYSGGGGGNNSGTCCPAGGGGGSFNTGANPSNLSGVQLGDGMVVITLLQGPPNFSKAFAPNFIAPGGISTLVFSLDSGFNFNPVADVAFADNLPAGMVIAAPANPVNSCNGVLTANEGEAVISLANGSIPANASCEISVDVTAAIEGIYDNVSGTLSSSLGVNPNPATASLTVTSLPLFVKQFSAAQAAPGDTVSLSLSIDNSANVVEAVGASFLDVFPEGMIVATPLNVSGSCGGTVSVLEGGDSIALSDGSIAAGDTCEIAVDVVALTTGAFVNTSGNLISSLGDSGQASDTINVTTAPLFTMQFSADVVAPDTPVALLLIVDNSFNPLAASDVSFSNQLPAGMVVSTPSNVSNSCGGTLSVAEGGSSIGLVSGLVELGDFCEIGLNVEMALTGLYNNVTGELTSSLGNSGVASASVLVALPTTLTVTDTGDMGDGVCDASCTLRDAVDSSNSGDTIDFDPGLPAPVVAELSGPPLLVDGQLLILATPGVRTAVRRVAGTGRLMEVTAGGNLQIVGLDFEGGIEQPMLASEPALGGAILTAAGSSLELSNTTFRNNSAIGASASGSEVPGGMASGGAVHAAGNLLLRNCAFVGNSATGGAGLFGMVGGMGATAGGAALGGAVAAAGVLDVVNCTFSSNAATGGDGGSGGNGGMNPGGDGGNGGDASGGAVHAYASAASAMAFSTLVENTSAAGSGGFGGSGVPSGLQGANGQASGAAIDSIGALVIDNSLLAMNSGAASCAGGDLSLRSGNRVDDTSCPGTEIVGLASELVPIDSDADSPNYQPRFSSSAVDAAADCLDAVGVETVAADQLGTARPSSGTGTLACDFGAIEVRESIFSNGFEESL